MIDERDAPFARLLTARPTTRFALDELRKWKRHPRGRGNITVDDEEFELDVEDHRDIDPVSENLANEELDIFHNLLFGLEWKRVSVVLWVFRAAHQVITSVTATKAKKQRIATTLVSPRLVVTLH